MNTHENNELTPGTKENWLREHSIPMQAVKEKVIEPTEPKAVLASAQESGAAIARQSFAAIKNSAVTSVEGHKADIAAGLHSLANGLQETCDSMNKDQGSRPVAIAGLGLASGVANKVEALSGYIGNLGVNQMLSDVRDLAKRQPLAFIGGAFVLGVAASRFFRSGMTEASQPARS